MRRALFLAAFAAACGGPPEVELAVDAHAVTAAATYELRVFGAKADCTQILKSPDTYFVERCRTAADADAGNACALLHANVAPGDPAHFEGITPGTRAVFVVGDDAAGNHLSKGCQSVEIQNGARATVTVTMQGY